MSCLATWLKPTSLQTLSGSYYMSLWRNKDNIWLQQKPGFKAISGSREHIMSKTTPWMADTVHSWAGRKFGDFEEQNAFNEGKKATFADALSFWCMLKIWRNWPRLRYYNSCESHSQGALFQETGLLNDLVLSASENSGLFFHRVVTSFVIQSLEKLNRDATPLLEI